jgi:hypothetical protein
MIRSARGTLARSLAAMALVGLYTLGILGVSSFAGVQPAQARRGHGGGRRGGGGGRRGGRGRRGARGGIWLDTPYLYDGYDDDCYWSPARRRWVCPYYYSPYRYYW